MNPHQLMQPRSLIPVMESNRITAARSRAPLADPQGDENKDPGEPMPPEEKPKVPLDPEYLAWLDELL
jgi:hypothetical protein